MLRDPPPTYSSLPRCNSSATHPRCSAPGPTPSSSRFKTIWCFDASGAVRTIVTSQVRLSPSLLSDFERVAAVFVALAYCSPEQLGTGAFGRRTTVYSESASNRPDKPEDDVAVNPRMSLQHEDRKSEVKFFRHAKKRNVDNLSGSSESMVGFARTSMVRNTVYFECSSRHCTCLSLQSSRTILIRILWWLWSYK